MRKTELIHTDSMEEQREGVFRNFMGVGRASVQRNYAQVVREVKNPALDITKLKCHTDIFI